MRDVAAHSASRTCRYARRADLKGTGFAGESASATDADDVFDAMDRRRRLLVAFGVAGVLDQAG